MFDIFETNLLEDFSAELESATTDLETDETIQSDLDSTNGLYAETSTLGDVEQSALDQQVGVPSYFLGPTGGILINPHGKEYAGVAEQENASIEDTSTVETYETIEPGTVINGPADVRLKDWKAFNEELEERRLEDDKNTFIMADARDNINLLEYRLNRLPYWKEEELDAIDEELSAEYDRLGEAYDAYFQDDINRIWIDGYTTPDGKYVAAHWRSPSGMAPEPDTMYEFDSENDTWIFTGYTSGRNEWKNDHYYLEKD